ncbi:MAG: threonylcarbamoyl-AMP synthase [Candidatus Diapherotrites archaeon]|uniref:L-threonylcarbamoyladenylate synthase n=1 Tax=Candidatus Iainarchaeum sp. TaxID=3101447 RepID=A0A938YXV1_9ARCH|nr:threonylcarbamoyl-AMP synthase [Candidatus Diapherotrites archaeon]
MAIIKQILGGNERAILEKAARIMKDGGVVVFPTESSYGLGTDALNENAIKKLGMIKQQPDEKNISVIVSNLEQAKEFGLVNEEAEKLVQKFMPGPLTLVVPKRANVPDALSERTIAFRISSNRIASELCKAVGNAITATSANLHGRPSIYSAKEVIKEFNNRVHMIIDAGELPRNQPSTIYDVGNKRVLRHGPVKEQEIMKALEE